MLRNWLGDPIEAGDIVYRGARDGNSSSFKIGVVQSVNEQKGTVRVRYLLEDGMHFFLDTSNPGYNGKPSYERLPYKYRYVDSVGTLSPESLVRLDCGAFYLTEKIARTLAIKELGSAREFHGVDEAVREINALLGSHLLEASEIVRKVCDA